jgi:hypothetical protein
MDLNQEQPDLLQMLADYFGPASAEAAQRRTPVANQIQDPTEALFRQLQQANQMRRMQMSEQQNQLRERELKLREQKATPPSPGNIQAQLQQILQGQGQGGDIPELDIRSRNSQTGTPYFSNYRAAPGSSPEEQARVDQLYQERQGKVATAQAASKGKGGISEDVLAQASQLSTILSAAKVPPETISLILRTTFPSIGDAKRTEGVKPIAQDKLANFFNKKTGATAAEDFPDSEPDQAALKRNYISLVGKDKDRYGNLQALDNTINQYTRLGGSLGLPEQPGLMSTLQGAGSMKLNRMSGGTQAADLDSVNSQITALARSFGGDSRVSDKEMALLRGAVISDGDNQAAVATKMSNLKRFRDTIAKLLPLPGIQNKYTREAGEAAAQQNVTPEQRAQASTLIVKAKQQLGASATPDQIKDLARKLMSQQGNR